ncbi:MAG: hypothetical protein P4L81_07945, partial [Candidatus Pacebacteria bacterium]|nr:hypothetical protein [Candidatus Paceibacterota bacterium]
RAVYAMASYDLIPGKKMSLIGYISRVLGHASATNAAYYQRVKVVNLTGPYQPEVKEEKEAEETESDWVARTAPEKKRVKAILELIEHREKITASAIRRTGGGTIQLAARVIELNQERVDAYNNSLEQ